MNKIVVELEGHGTFEVTDSQMDWAINRFLPTSCAELRTRIEEATGLDYSDVTSPTALLAVLADMDAPEAVR